MSELLVDSRAIEKQNFRAFFKNSAKKSPCVCGEHRSLPLITQDRYKINIAPRLCLNCGHIYSSKVLDDFDLTQFYRKFYRKFYSKGKAESDEKVRFKVESGRRHIFGLIDDICPDLKGKTIYEWGASGGWNLVPFQEAGCLVEGFDLDESMALLAQNRFKIKVNIIQYPLDVPDRSQLCDILIANHVIEHVREPFLLIQALRKLLKDGGLFYVGIPVLESAYLWGFREFFHIAHIHYFLSNWFITVMEQLGFQLCKKLPKKGVFVFRKIPGDFSSKNITYPKHQAESLLRFFILFLKCGHIIGLIRRLKNSTYSKRFKYELNKFLK